MNALSIAPIKKHQPICNIELIHAILTSTIKQPSPKGREKPTNKEAGNMPYFPAGNSQLDLYLLV